MPLAEVCHSPRAITCDRADSQAGRRRFDPGRPLSKKAPLRRGFSLSNQRRSIRRWRRFPQGARFRPHRPGSNHRGHRATSGSPVALLDHLQTSASLARDEERPRARRQHEGDVRVPRRIEAPCDRRPRRRSMGVRTSSAKLASMGVPSEVVNTKPAGSGWVGRMSRSIRARTQPGGGPTAEAL